ncbi:hypothetical protein A2160_01360 [Candidatus Beckwithbacteria bacterium RBG_13_42_9]|uniref:Serine protease n=1 Tax=Candidatus Beckwithbacteria bacterium RBG_13_42_9 TaxID=1797457 RepID=A0A1F5E4D2_9BACT|nr:MAG: hypothetical protein A2160_01360 [Candidatus Beckwithbacteria bacterium RBG_13_42_9]
MTQEIKDLIAQNIVRVYAGGHSTYASGFVLASAEGDKVVVTAAHFIRKAGKKAGITRFTVSTGNEYLLLSGETITDVPFFPLPGGIDIAVAPITNDELSESRGLVVSQGLPETGSALQIVLKNGWGEPIPINGFLTQDNVNFPGKSLLTELPGSVGLKPHYLAHGDSGSPVVNLATGEVVATVVARAGVEDETGVIKNLMAGIVLLNR